MQSRYTHTEKENDDEYSKDNRSVSSRISSHTMGSTATTSNSNEMIRPWEPTFISTFALCYQISRLGLILLIIYLIDNYPPYGSSRSSQDRKPSFSSSSQSYSEFDEDQFIFWIFVLVVYGYVISWRRNDGRPNGDDNNKHEPLTKATTTAVESSASAAATGSAMSKHKMRAGRRRRNNAASSSIGSKSSGDNSDNVDKRLEEVLLDDGSNDDDFETASLISGTAVESSGVLITRKGDQRSWPEQVSSFLGLHYLNEKNTNSGVVQDVKHEEDILNRHQTLEWRGFLSAALLIYQFNNGGIHQTSWNDDGSSLTTGNSRAKIYENLCHVAMSSILFLTGYVHTCYFYYHPLSNNDSYRMSRIICILCRINLLAILLSLVSGTVEYTACPMITYCFLLVWLTMSYWSSINYDKYQFRLKLLGLAIFIFIVWDCDISNVTSYDGTQNSFQSVLYEWYCLSHKHHWASFMGMVFAINQPIASWQLRKLESLHILIQIGAKGAILLSLVGAVMIWAAGPLHMPTFVYNISHPYFGIIPVLAYIYLRNICSAMRKHYIGMLSSLGEYSLEIYLLHYHAFTDSGCVLFISGYPRCNFLLVTMLVLVAARVLHHLSIILLRMLFPQEDDDRCIQHATYVAAGIIISCALTAMLDWSGLVNVGTITTITIVCGILLYQSVIDKMWDDYKDSGAERAQRHNSDFAFIKLATTKVGPPLIGTAILLIVWSIWSFSGGPLHPCGLSANDGHWVPVNPCLSRGRLHREYHATDYLSPEECSKSTAANLQWTWQGNSHCRYRYHTDMEIQQKLQGKRVVLIGDSSIRSLFHSLSRFMGDDTVGSEGTAASHSDATKRYGSTTLEYKWAPLSTDISTKLKAFKAATSRQPDIVIAGGGSWDRLHFSVTEDDLQSQQDTITKLARSLVEVNAPVVWFVPPTINTQALNSDDKRTQMSEERMAEMRQMYIELGVTSSVSFVLDGPSFTRERVAESYDGIHYPSAIYDAGAQILFNAFDKAMILQSASITSPYHLPKPGSLGIPYLGLMMICIALIGLFFFDAYFGVSYLAQVFVMNDTVSPGELYNDAFAAIFKRLKMTLPQDQNGEDGRTQDDVVSYDGGGDDSSRREMNELLGRRSSSSLSRRHS